MRSERQETFRIRVWSDLHLEMRRNRVVAESLPSDVDADLVVLAGDIANGTDGVRWAAEAFSGLPVAYVLGNHELYGHDIDAAYDACHEAARGTLVRVLECEAWDVHPGLRVIGGTLWTDFTLWGTDRVAVAEAESEALRMADFQLIRTDDRRLAPADTKFLHDSTRRWLESELSRAATAGVAAIVVTHHAPHESCLADHHLRVRDPLSPAFATDLSALMVGPHAPVAWCSGHTHHNRGGVVGRTRLVANQAGYVFRGEGKGYVADGILLEIGPGPPRRSGQD